MRGTKEYENNKQISECERLEGEQETRHDHHKAEVTQEYHKVDVTLMNITLS